MKEISEGDIVIVRKDSMWSAIHGARGDVQGPAAKVNGIPHFNVYVVGDGAWGNPWVLHSGEFDVVAGVEEVSDPLKFAYQRGL
ncbi:MAG: hypothetical protein AB7I96_13005 [Candidatus Dadabacteria bacterium]